VAEGIWNAVIPALAVLVAVDLVFGGIAVYYLNRTSSASAR
jgi:ABC-2 type transport system permease protein